MFRIQVFKDRRMVSVAAVAALMLVVVAAANAQSADSKNGDVIGRIDFEQANLPPANVEIDLKESMFTQIFGLGDAAIAGVAETLSKSSEASAGTRLAAEQLAAARQIIQLASKVVREVRVRGYEKMPDDLSSHLDGQLRGGSWENIVLLRQGDDNVRVSLLRSGESVRGVFVMVGDHGGLVLVNVVCDVSPDNVKELTSAATKIGLENGLAQAIEAKMKRFPARLPTPPTPPTAPAPPAAPAVGGAAKSR